MIEHRVVRLRHGLRLGDAHDAAVSFPGVCLTLARDARGWTLGGHRLVRGRRLSLSLERCEIDLHLVDADPLPQVFDDLPDIRLLVATAAMALLLAAANVFQRTAATHPEVAAALQAYVLGADPSSSAEAATPPEPAEPPAQWRAPVSLHPAQ